MVRMTLLIWVGNAVSATMYAVTSEVIAKEVPEEPGLITEEPSGG